MSQVFNTAYAAITETVAFNPKWNNGTEYYDHAVQGKHAPELAFGQIVKSVSPMPNNRRLIIIGTPLGNVVLFDRYTDCQDGVIVHNSTTELKKLVGGMVANLSEDTLRHLLGDFHNGQSLNNIGKAMKKIFETWGMVEA